MANFIKSIFTFKSKFEKVFNNESVKDIIQRANRLIVAYKDYKDLSGAEKKNKVDKLLTTYILEKYGEFAKENIFVNWVLNKFIEFLPDITQLVYDFLKKRIEGLTEKEGA
ncbi:TPA: hypothetical protein CPT89_00975 [Candidatus Gastranaerophilales bacterium HUM_11]|nr:MAG TPA: hypothetical protein CPT89_00975 [Candidatus Gastranaerophilales bacterium HUM_11]DAX39341.1 MAG TPA: hypothetical protein [Caudoviricetes sp.]